MWHQTQQQKKKSKLDIIKIKNFYASTKKVKRQPIEQEKICVTHVSDKFLLSRIYKQLLKFNNKNTTNPIF